MTMFGAELFNGIADAIVRDGSELLLVAAAIVTGFVLFWLVPPENKVREAKRKVRLQAQAKSMKAFEDFQDSGDDQNNQGEHDLLKPKLASADEYDCEDVSGAADIDVNDVADVFMRLSRAFSSADESEDEDDNHVVPECTGSTSDESASEVDQVADVCARMSRVFSSVDADDDDDENQAGHEPFSREPTGSTFRQAPSEVDSMTDVFRRMSRVFSSVCEEDDDDDFGSSNLPMPELTPSMGPTHRTGNVNVVHVADVFSTVFKVLSSADADQDEDEHFSPARSEPTLGASSGTAGIEINNVADVFKKLSKVFSSIDEDDVDDERNVGIPLKVTPTIHALTPLTAKSDVDEVACLFSRLSKAFSSYEDEPDGSLMIAQKADGTASSDGSTYGGATSDSEDEITSWEGSDSEGEIPGGTTD